ncbi:glycerophosphodiester phosphodiesterase family protein [Qipengyuania sp. JC766]|uniref:glycerophosphodiester phosphodiesterase family protein n=1 Tax=Qipengyuania sp. JC766 TaxID=3232139 RepID=UPI003459C733
MRLSRPAIAAGLLACVLPLAAQGQDDRDEAGEGAWSIATNGSLSDTLDCFEREGRTLVSAHRGGPTPGLPENSIEAMDALLHEAPAIMEIDVAGSRDGVLFLMHDDTLDRTTTGTGEAAALDWPALSALRLRDASGWVTPYGIPTLQAALAWAKGRTVLQIDFKRSASYEDTIAAIREAGMTQDVVLIAYSVGSAVRLHQLAPDMTISLSMEEAGALDEAVTAGIPADRLVAFTGTRTVRPDLYAALDAADVEVIFGTLGGSRSLDRQFERDGSDARYAELGVSGVDIIATDRPREAARALREAGRMAGTGVCGVGREAG